MALPRQWQLKVPRDESAEQSLAAQHALSPILAQLLHARVGDEAQIKSFLQKDFSTLSAPRDFPCVSAAAERLLSAIISGEAITVFGDYDTDGLTATALLWQVLKRLGAKVAPFIPDRESEGYGLTASAMVRCLTNTHPHLLITVDCGITSVDQCAWLAEQGVEVIITDHHTPAESLPAVSVIVNPHVASCCPESAFCGCAVAYKVATHLVELAQEAGLSKAMGVSADDYLDFVALATVADIIDLTGESRVLVDAGLRMMNRHLRPTFKELLARQNQAHKEITAEMLAFSLVPVLNAAGRMNQPKDAMRFLLMNDPDQIVSTMQGYNDKRKALEQLAVQEIMSQKIYHEGDPAIVAVGHYHPGIIGLIAARLLDVYHVPVAVISLEDGGTGARGSMRSTTAVNAVQVLQACEAHLTACGGHAAAAGFGLGADQVEAFTQAFKRACHAQQEASPEQGAISCWIDCELTSGQIDNALLDDLNRLQPLGAGNPKPLFALCQPGTKIELRKPCGKDQSHLQVVFKTADGKSLKAIWFSGAKCGMVLDIDADYDIAFTVHEDTFRERKPGLQLVAIQQRGGQ